MGRVFVLFFLRTLGRGPTISSTVCFFRTFNCPTEDPPSVGDVVIEDGSRISFPNRTFSKTSEVHGVNDERKKPCSMRGLETEL